MNVTSVTPGLLCQALQLNVTTKPCSSSSSLSFHFYEFVCQCPLSSLLLLDYYHMQTLCGRNLHVSRFLPSPGIYLETNAAATDYYRIGVSTFVIADVAPFLHTVPLEE